MKKINVLLIVVFSVILVSCGGKNKETLEDSKVVVKAAVPECGCEELDLLEKLDTTRVGKKNVFNYYYPVVNTMTKKKFTGICVEKDQNDSILRRVELKNGGVIKEIVRIKINKNYITLKNMNYEDSECLNGWEIFIEDQGADRYVSSYHEIKNGEFVNRWNVGLDDYDGDGIQNLHTNWEIKDGNLKDKPQPKCMPEAQYTEYNNWWSIEGISPQRLTEVFNCLRKELPQFNYWK